MLLKNEHDEVQSDKTMQLITGKLETSQLNDYLQFGGLSAVGAMLIVLLIVIIFMMVSRFVKSNTNSIYS